MSLWRIAENSSVRLVESFFKHIKGGKGKLEAFRAARSEIRQDWLDHPFFRTPSTFVAEVD